MWRGLGTLPRFLALRDYDSVQLAAAHELHDKGRQPVIFASDNRDLKPAAPLLQMGGLH